MIKLGLPSKGRLQQNCFDWFAACGVKIERAEEGREYSGRVVGAEGVELVLLSAAEVPRELAAGRIDLGVTGEDMVRERIPNANALISLEQKLGFGHADLVIAVPSVWIDVDTLHDLDAAAAAFRKAHGRRLRIATKYHNLARAFLTEQGVADYQLVDSQGATEATPLNQTAEAIIDITSSGETLRANHLKTLRDGLILKSEANLCRSLTSGADCSAFLDRLGL
ncbi:MAG: ATP phosphoribosyltransferase [Pseudomonadota bacterium]